MEVTLAGMPGECDPPIEVTDGGMPRICVAAGSAASVRNAVTMMAVRRIFASLHLTEMPPFAAEIHAIPALPDYKSGLRQIRFNPSVARRAAHAGMRKI